MVFLFCSLAVVAALWEVWVAQAFVMGRALPPPHTAILWWLGFAANSALLLWMVIDCMGRPLKSSVRKRWLVAIIFLGVIGSSAYFFMVRMRNIPNHEQLASGGPKGGRP